MARLIGLGLFAVVVAIVSTSWAAVAAAAPSCSVVNEKLLPCLSYIRGTGEPSSACCDGVKEISALAPSTADLIGVCNCIKAELPKIGNSIPSRIAGLPKSCGVNRNFPPVDANYDCSKITD